MAAEKILIVDDEKSMCQFLSIMLRKEGYQITAAHNGKKALDQFQKNKFDLVITDIRMSGMDGIELLSELKKIDQTVPVIIMTAYASQKTAIDAVNHGAFHYLIKQATLEDVIIQTDIPNLEIITVGVKNFLTSLTIFSFYNIFINKFLICIQINQ